MQEFPKFSETEYIKTRRQMHLLARILGSYREALVEPIAKNDNLWLSAAEQGFGTPPMEKYSELEIGCNLDEFIIEIDNDKGGYTSCAITGKSAVDLCGEITGILSGEFGITAGVDAEKFKDAGAFTGVLTVEAAEARSFLGQFTGFAELLTGFHKKISEGTKTGVCLWPHHFDNAFKWFSGRRIDDADEQMGIGVSNGDEMYELPYVYMTIYPELRKMNTLEIPEGAHLHDTGWQGLILPYEAVLEKRGPESQSTLINNFLDESFAGIKRGFSKR